MTFHSVLHPRLLAGEARKRFEQQVPMRLEELRETAAQEDAAAVYAPVGAPRIGRNELSALQKTVRECAEAHGYPNPPSRESGRAFDRALARIMLQEARLVPGEASAPDVWSFHALVLLPDVAHWRWRNPDGSINVERIVCSDLTRHAFARMWWRGYLLSVRPDGTLDLEGLRRLDAFGEADFDQIQARRSAYGHSPTVFQTIADLSRDPAIRRRFGDGGMPRDVLRDFLKRLLRLGAFVSYDALPPEALRAGLEEALDETIRALGQGDPPSSAAGSPAPRPGGGPGQAQVASESDGAPAGAPRLFDEVPFRDFPLLFAQVIGRDWVPTAKLPMLFRDNLRIEVPPKRERMLTRLAWVSAGLGFLEHDDDADAWRMTGNGAAADRRWGDWSIATMTARCRELLATRDHDAARAELLKEVFRSNGRSRFAWHVATTVLREAGERRSG